MNELIAAIAITYTSLVIWVSACYWIMRWAHVRTGITDEGCVHRDIDDQIVKKAAVLDKLNYTKRLTVYVTMFPLLAYRFEDSLWQLLASNAVVLFCGFLFAKARFAYWCWHERKRKEGINGSVLDY